MASSTDRTEDALPRPELNPLLNPILADNMGRWAEVYFTSPPEKREEAVLDLLRELQARGSEQSPRAVPTSVPSTLDQGMAIPYAEKASAERQINIQTCHACGHPNPQPHQFCGMCGAKLEGEPSELGPEEIDNPRNASNEHAYGSGYSESPDEYREPAAEEYVPPARHSSSDPYDLSLFQGLREGEATVDFEYEQSPSVRYRYYIGVILAVLIIALGYMAWRSGQASENVQGTPPAPPPAATDTNAAAANQNNTATTSTTPPKAAEPQTLPVAKTTPEPGTAKKPETPERTPEPTASTAEGRAPQSKPAPSAPPANMEGQQSLSGNGAEDFAVAQSYLSGTSGHARDSAEAAKWLWKAMANHNGPAMVALADLYLKGDGVSKNCDQARVLLDSAAQRGVAGAGTRLRNLQAFGCQ